MSIQIGQKPSPTFAEPLALLSDCHRRVESFLRTLRLVAEQAHGCELNPQQREALETALRYFREAAPKHTADEEESLFPRMREHGNDVSLAALDRIQALEVDHQVAGVGHALVEKLGGKWLAVGQLGPDEAARLLASLRELQAIYERHIAVEDNEVFPLAAKVLNSDSLTAVGREMAARRGQDFDWQSQLPHH